LTSEWKGAILITVKEEIPTPMQTSKVNLSQANHVTGTIVNPSDSADIREVQWTKVYGGWRDDSPNSKTNGKIYSEATMLAIVEQYSDLKVS
jgi:hypothetical protein